MTDDLNLVAQSINSLNLKYRFSKFDRGNQFSKFEAARFFHNLAKEHAIVSALSRFICSF